MSGNSESISHRKLITLWCIVVTVLCAYIITFSTRHVVFDSDIMSLIPGNNQKNSTSPSELSSAFENRFTLLLNHPDPETGLQLAEDLISNLEASPMIEMTSGDDFSIERFQNYFYPYRYQLISRQQKQQLSDLSSRELADQVISELYSPISTFRLYSFSEDPLNLGGNWLLSLFPELSRINPTVVPSVTGEEGLWYLVNGVLTESPYKLSAQKALRTEIVAIQEKEPEVNTLASGIVFHATEATNNARFEISAIGLSSLALIIALIAVFFRSFRAAGAIAFVLFSSYVTAFAATLLVFGEVHLVTMAFGSTLLGIAVDYTFHFLVRNRAQNITPGFDKALTRGLCISASSSILAYILQLISPFPGLQQFAVFISMGLVGAVISVLLISRHYTETTLKPFTVTSRFFSKYVITFYRQLLTRRFSLLSIMALITTILSTNLIIQKGSDDIRLLNSSSPELLYSERKIQNLLNSFELQKYFNITGSDPEDTVLRMEEFFEKLGTDPDIQASGLSMILPSSETQTNNLLLLNEKVYGAAGTLSILCQTLDTDCSDWPTPGADQTQPLQKNMLPEWLDDIFLPLAVSQENSGLVLFRHNSMLSEATAHELSQEPWAEYIDQAGIISEILTEYRSVISLLLIVFLLALTLAFYKLYGRSKLIVLLSIFISLIAAASTSLPAGITLFHILALLLILGLGIDTCIFYLELGFSHETWLASSLSAVTTILVFGVLSLSQIPVLHHFGSVIFVGMLSIWLLTPAFILWSENSFKE